MHRVDCHYARQPRLDAPALSKLRSAEELHHAMCTIEALATQGRWQLGITPDTRAEFGFLLLPC